MSVPTMSDIRQNVGNERSLLIFYAAMLVAMMILLDNASTLDEAAARIPRYVILATLVVMGIHTLLILVGQPIKGFQGTDVDDFADEDVNMSDVNLPALIKEMVWICGYVAGLLYIGFFTTTFVFVYVYIFVKDMEIEGVQKLIVSGIWAAGITGLLYILIVQVLKNYSFLRLGMFP